MEEGGGSERRGGPSEGETRSLRAEAAEASCTVSHPPEPFFQFVRGLNHMTVAAFVRLRIREGRMRKQLPRNQGPAQNPQINQPAGREGHDTKNSQPECRHQRCGGRQVAACWPACLDPDNSRSPHPLRKLRSDHQTDRGAQSVSIQPKRITTRGRKAGQPPSAPSKRSNPPPRSHKDSFSPVTYI